MRAPRPGTTSRVSPTAGAPASMRSASWARAKVRSSRADAVDQRVQLGQDRPHRVGELGQHAKDLAFFLARGLDQLVVGLDHALGLDEERGAALGAVVHDAPQPALGLGANRQDVAAVADGDVALLKRVLGAGRLEIALERLDEVAPEIADPLPHPAQGGAGLVAHAAVVIEAAAEQIGQRLEMRKGREGGGQGGGDGLDAPAIGAESTRRVQQRDQRGQLGGLGH